MKMFRVPVLWCLLLVATLSATAAQAQPTQNGGTTIISEPNVEMADVLRQDGKIYVVVAVLLTVLGGVLVYLISLDRKVSKLEKEVESLGVREFRS